MKLTRRAAIVIYGSAVLGTILAGLLVGRYFESRECFYDTYLSQQSLEHNKQEIEGYCFRTRMLFPFGG